MIDNTLLLQLKELSKEASQMLDKDPSDWTEKEKNIADSQLWQYSRYAIPKLIKSLETLQKKYDFAIEIASEAISRGSNK